MAGKRLEGADLTGLGAGQAQWREMFERNLSFWNLPSKVIFSHNQNSVAGDFSALDRRDGYAAVLAEHGLAPWTYAPAAPAPFDAGREALETLTRGRKKADAIIFANDNLAAGALLASQRMGIEVPRQCALMGFGDYPFSGLLLPSLTTIRPPAREIGELAARRILEALGEIEPEGGRTGNAGRLNLLGCELVERESA